MYLRKLPFVILLCCFACLAFGLGYVAYPLLHQQAEPVAADPVRPGDAGAATATHTPASSAADGADLLLLREVWHLLERDFYGTRPDADVQRYGAVRGLVESYDDPYTFFVEPQPRELEQDNLRGSFGGIGAYILRDEEGFRLSPMPGQPAAVAGVLEGDLLLLVDDEEITLEMSEEEVVTLIRGPVDTEVVLVVRRTDGDVPADDIATDGPATDEPAIGETGVGISSELTIPITRAVIETPSIEVELLDLDTGQSVEEAAPAANADPAGEVRPLVGYIKQVLYTERTPAEMEQAIRELTAAGADRFLLDLRGNPGGILSSAVQTADFWLDDGMIMREERADGAREEIHAEPGGPGVGYPLVVIVDGASASASEIVAGALQDNGRARLVGEQTFGKGSVQLIHGLSDESSLHVTTAEWFTPSGRQISGQGLTPDVVIEPGSDPRPVALDELRVMSDE